MKHWKLVLAGVVVVAALVYYAGDAPSFGSVGVSDEYMATTTRDFKGSVMPNLSVLKIGPGALGSVVITGAAAGQLTLYDATSTRTNTEWATTTLATFPLSTAAGTYTFDVAFKRGLLVEIITATGTSTITFR